LNRLAELVDSGKIKTQIDKVFPIDQASEAFKYLSEGHPRGKVIVKIKG
jgi:NADPH:quinone reductase-like Zn-dependent oxidoreductase